MALQKQQVVINFAKGLDTKSDPFQVPVGNFLSLQNTVFDKIGRLQKRNGYPALPSLPDTSSTFLTTFNSDLTAIGTSLQALSLGSSTWSNRGNIQPLNLSTMPLVRNNLNQSQCDSVVSSSNLVCTVYTESNGTSNAYKYIVEDSTTGQVILSPGVLTTADPTYGAPRVFLLGYHFVIVFSALIGSNHHLQYLAINATNPSLVGTPTDISTQYTPHSRVSFDGVAANNQLFLAWSGSDVGGAVRMTYLNTSLQQANTVIYAGRQADIMSICADNSTTTPTIYATFHDSGDSNTYTLAVSHTLANILSPTIIGSSSVANIATAANNQTLTAFVEVPNAYGYDSGIPTNYVQKVTCTQTGTVGAIGVVLRSVGLASKAFLLNSKIYALFAHSSQYQPTYFLADSGGNITGKLAYQNGGGYLTTGLPSVTVTGNDVQIPYLYKDLIQAVNKDTNVTAGTQVNGIYSQTGINLATFSVQSSDIVSAEIGSNLNLSGGFIWAYDGYQPTEQGFFVYPDSIEATPSASGGSMSAQKYYYQVTYEWTDNQGNAFRSAPSIPITVTTTTGSSSVSLNVPTLRLTYKTSSALKIVIYRWSAAQESYYQVTSINQPLLNNPAVDYVTFTDTLSDATILGNNLIYTTGGVVENISPPAANTLTLFDDRLWLVDAEDPNLLWYSKQVIEATPVEMSDLFTVYVAPNISAQGATGPITALSALDDKLVIFKANAMYFMSGTGPDNTGANNQYGQPTFVTATIGCNNQHSIVYTPHGIMFQSDKGIWLLGRDLSTTYIGAPVEGYTTGATVQSAVNIPGTNQVRFTLDTGITLMYDYYVSQWSTFTGVPAISSTLYQGYHTFLNALGQVYQESPGTYLDGSNPVLMSFITNWINIAGLQGFERAYHFYLLGNYISPHKLNVQIAYDYAPGPSQTSLISPDNYSGTYGTDSLYGNGNPYGGTPTLEQWRVFLQQMKCQSFQIYINEIYDSTFGVPPGAGLTLSGLNLTVGTKLGRPKLRAGKSVG